MRTRGLCARTRTHTHAQVQRKANTAPHRANVAAAPLRCRGLTSSWHEDLGAGILEGAAG